MNYMIYFGIGILVHLMSWGGELYGLYSIALLVFWPFFVTWHIILFLGYYVLPIVVIVLVCAYIWDRLNGSNPNY